jgi:hypothetical protein
MAFKLRRMFIRTGPMPKIDERVAALEAQLKQLDEPTRVE